MPRKEGQKLKLLALLTILARETDENHPLSVPRLVEMLRERGINAERKSVYDDIETLNAIPNAPFEIVQQRGRGGGYYMTECPFELAELKLLVDAVYTSKFITASKSRTLIDKLGRFTSRYRQAELDRTVLVSGRVKSHEERILYSVDALHTAITRGWQVQFTYCDWNLQKQMVPRHGGKRYQVSPWALVWENGYYYLIAYTDGHLRHYRVDKMAELAVTCLPLEGVDGELDIASYAQKHFGMFSGREGQITLRCANRLVGVVLDRFGREAMLVPDGADHFTVTVPAVVSPQFLGWIFGLGDGVRILRPDWAAEEMRRQLAAVAALYQ